MKRSRGSDEETVVAPSKRVKLTEEGDRDREDDNASSMNVDQPKDISALPGDVLATLILNKLSPRDLAAAAIALKCLKEEVNSPLFVKVYTGQRKEPGCVLEAPLLAWNDMRNPHPTVALDTAAKRWVKVPIPNVPSDRCTLLSYSRGLFLFQVHPEQKAVATAQIAQRILEVRVRSKRVTEVEDISKVGRRRYMQSLARDLSDCWDVVSEVKGQTFLFHEMYGLRAPGQLVVCNPLTGAAKWLPVVPDTTEIRRGFKLAYIKVLDTEPESYQVSLAVSAINRYRRRDRKFLVYNSMDGLWRYRNDVRGGRYRDFVYHGLMEGIDESGKEYHLRRPGYKVEDACISTSYHHDYSRSSGVKAYTRTLRTSPAASARCRAQEKEFAKAWFAQLCVCQEPDDPYAFDVAHCEVTERLMILVQRSGAKYAKFRRGRGLAEAPSPMSKKVYPVLLSGASAGAPSTGDQPKLELCSQGHHHLCALDDGAEGLGAVRLVVYDFGTKTWEEWAPPPVALPAWSSSQFLKLRYDLFKAV